MQFNLELLDRKYNLYTDNRGQHLGIKGAIINVVGIFKCT